MLGGKSVVALGLIGLQLGEVSFGPRCHVASSLKNQFVACVWHGLRDLSRKSCTPFG